MPITDKQDPGLRTEFLVPQYQAKVLADLSYSRENGNEVRGSSDMLNDWERTQATVSQSQHPGARLFL